MRRVTTIENVTIAKLRGASLAARCAEEGCDLRRADVMWWDRETPRSPRETYAHLELTPMAYEAMLRRGWRMWLDRSQ